MAATAKVLPVKQPVRQLVEEELETLFLDADALQGHQQKCLTGQGEQILSKLTNISTDKAEQHFERNLDNSQAVFGPDAPANNQKTALKSLLHALAFSSTRTPGFTGLQSVVQRSSQGEQQTPAASGGPLLRLLRRVALWWYYRVMLDPLEQLLALSSSYELLFQLMSPHQQLSCMADILLVLACPALHDNSGQLDTPLHTATLLSMLKMAQQLALAEAQLQEQLSQQEELQLRVQAACPAAAVLTSPADTLLRMARQLPQCFSQDQQSGAQDLLRLAVASAVCGKHLPSLHHAAEQAARPLEVIGTPCAEMTLQQSNSARAVGSLLAQVSQLSRTHLELWWHAYDAVPPQGEAPCLQAAILHHMHKCCSALQSCQLPPLTPEGADPVQAVLASVLRALGIAGGGGGQAGETTPAEAHSPRAEGAQQQQQQESEPQHEQHQAAAEGQQPRSPTSSQQQPQQQQGQEGSHPAEALRQLLDVLLTALEAQHAAHMDRWIAGPSIEGKTRLLAALHCHCIQLLAQARDRLPAGACLLGHHASSSSAATTSSTARPIPEREPQEQQQQLPQQAQAVLQQQRQACQLCMAQVQHNLLLALQLTHHWRAQEADARVFVRTLLVHTMDLGWQVEVMNPLGLAAVAAEVRDAACQQLEERWAQLEQCATTSELQRQELEKARQHRQFQMALMRAADAQQEPPSTAAAAAAARRSRSAAASSSRAAGASSSSSSSSSSASRPRRPAESGRRRQGREQEGADSWDQLAEQLQRLQDLIVKARKGEEPDPFLVGTCHAVGVQSAAQLMDVMHLSHSAAVCHVMGSPRMLQVLLAEFTPDQPGAADRVGRRLAAHVYELVRRLVDEHAAATCAAEVLTHASALERRRTGTAGSSAAAAGAAAGAAAASTSSGEACDGDDDPPVLRLKGGARRSSSGSSSADSSEAGDSSPGEGGSSGIGGATSGQPQHTPAVAAALPGGVLQAYEQCARIWESLLGGYRLPPQQVLTQLQQDEGGAAVAAASIDQIERFSPASLPSHFNSMSWPAAVQWLLLLRAAAAAEDSALVPALHRLPLSVVALGLPGCSESSLYSSDDSDDSSSDSGRPVGWPGKLWGAFMLLLVLDDSAWGAGAAWPNADAWAAAKQTLLTALDDAYIAASALCSAGSQVHRQVNKLVGNRVVCPLDDLLIQIQACGLADMFDISSEGLSSLQAVLDKCVEVVQGFFELLKPQDVKRYRSQDLKDPMLRNGVSLQTLHHWLARLDLCWQSVAALLHTDIQLARIGRPVQKVGKQLLRLQRALSAADTDPYLVGLRQHRMAHASGQLGLTLEASLQATHQQLRSTLEAKLVPKLWGATQRAYNLQVQLATARQQHKAQGRSWNDALDTFMEENASFLAELIERMTTHLSRISPSLPQPPHDWQVPGKVLGQETLVQELLILFSGMKPAVASVCFSLQPPRGALQALVSGEKLVYVSRPLSAAAAAPRSPGSHADRSSSTSSSSSDSTLLLNSCYDGLCDTGPDHVASYDSAGDEAATGRVLEAVQEAGACAADCDRLKQHLDRLRAQLAAYGGSPAAGDAQQQQHWNMLCAEKKETVSELQQAKHRRRDQRRRHQQLLKEVPSSHAWCSNAHESLSAVAPLGRESDSSCSSDSSSDDNDDSDAESPPAAPAAGLRLRLRQPGSSERQEPPLQQERRLQQRLRAGVQYRWGGARLWHAQRLRTLVVRQRQLNHVAELQAEAADSLERLEHMQQRASAAAAAAVQSSTRQRQQQQQQQQGMRPSRSSGEAWEALVKAAAAALAAGAAGKESGPHPAAAAAAELHRGPNAPLLLQLEQCRWSFFPGGAHATSQESSSGVAFVKAHRAEAAPLQRILQGAADMLHTQAALRELSAPGGSLFRDLLLPQLADALRQQQQGPAAATGGEFLHAVSTRQLLWEALQRFKPAACEWYQAAANHHQQQQQQASPSSSSSSSKAASVPDCTSPGLWSTLTRSLASDLLLVPPSIRDMVANGWAAGAGRLPGADGSSSSSALGVAARMLAVQYARAARRQYAMEYQPVQLLGQLLSLQLLADPGDGLTELQPGAARQVDAALAAYSAAAAAGMVPVFAATAAACELAVASGTSGQLSSSDRPAQQGSTSSSTGQGGEAQHHSSMGLACNSSSSSSSGATSLQGHAGSSRPSLFQLSAQAGVFAGPVELTLPWLQLLARYHALLAYVEKQYGGAFPEHQLRAASGREAPLPSFEGGCASEWRVLAMAKALQSFGAPLPACVAQLQRVAAETFATCAQPPVLASPVGTAIMAEQGLRGGCSGGLTAGRGVSLQQGQHSAQQHGAQQLCEQDAMVWAFCLHAERLMQQQPQAWQGLVQQAGSLGVATGQPHSSSDGADGSASQPQQQEAGSSSSSHVCLLADLACDWCGEPLPGEGSRPGVPGSGSSSKQGQPTWGCVSCGAAQYCSQQCAAAAKRVHAANCWRLQALASDGLCWKAQPTGGSFWGPVGGGAVSSLWHGQHRPAGASVHSCNIPGKPLHHLLARGQQPHVGSWRPEGGAWQDVGAHAHEWGGG